MTTIQANYIRLIENRLKLVTIALEPPMTDWHVTQALSAATQALDYLKKLETGSK